MKYAAIYSPSYYKWFRNLGVFCALAQYVLRDAKYAKQLQNRAREGAYIILDNGTPEGEPMDWDHLLDAANLIRADEVVIPDVQFDPERTRKIASEVLLKYSPERLMYVIQDKFVEEDLKFLGNVYRREGSMPVVGIPKWMEPDRMQVLRKIHRPGMRIHLLGFKEVPQDEIKRDRMALRGVRSIDTAAPLAYAQEGMVLGDWGEHVSFVWEGAVTNQNLILQNLRVMEAWCDQPYTVSPWWV